MFFIYIHLALSLLVIIASVWLMIKAPQRQNFLLALSLIFLSLPSVIRFILLPFMRYSDTFVAFDFLTASTPTISYFLGIVGLLGYVLILIKQNSLKKETFEQ